MYNSSLLEIFSFLFQSLTLGFFLLGKWKFVITKFIGKKFLPDLRSYRKLLLYCTSNLNFFAATYNTYLDAGKIILSPL